METIQTKYELVVLEGPQQGSRQPLRTAHAHGIGNAFDCDIYLHNSSETQYRIDVLPGRLSIGATLVSGEAVLDSKAMVQGQKYKLPLSVPVRIGDTLFTVENALPANDSEGANEVVNETIKPVDVGADTAMSSDGLAPGDVVIDPRGVTRLLRPRALIALIGLGLLGGGIQAWQFAPDNLLAASQTLSLEEHVRANTDGEVSVMATDGGAYMVKGWLPTRDAERKLNLALRQRSEEVVVKTNVATDIETSVGEVFRSHGLQANVSTLKPGRLVVRTQTGDLEQLAKAESSAKADVHGLEELSVVNTKPAEAVLPAKRAIPPDVDKDIQLVVVGSPSYVVAGDNATYFLGSKLPTGHRIESIFKDKVVVSKNGVTTELVM